MNSSSPRRALVTGATGYIGSLVLQRLLEEGWAVRTLSRSRDRARQKPWGDRVVDEGRTAGPGEVEVHEGDAADSQDVRATLEGIDVAWYLLHSMGTGRDFVREEQDMARVFAQAAAQAGIERIVFLGGLHPEGEELSEHLGSRVEVGRILMDSGVPTAALQAGVVLGAGSTSFHMLRHLAERLPGVVGPRWIRHRITPIGERDVVHYLVRAADLPPEQNRTFDIGGPEDMEYVQMMQRYARRIGLPRPLAFTAPVTTPNLGAQWISLVTPVDAEVARPLIGSLLHDTVVAERDLEALVGPPPGGNQTFEEAVDQAVEGTDLRRWFKTVAGVGGAVGACLAVGTVLSDPTNRWYRSLDLPSWQPPGFVFPVVWTALYADIAAVESLMVADAWESGNTEMTRNDVAALGVNLALNAGWSGLFFRAGRPVLSTVWAGALAVSSADLVRRAWRSAPQRGVLLAPYAAWTGFAAVLNGAIARRNRGGRRRPRRR